MASSIPLESLPEDLRVHICTYVAADCVKDLCNLQLVSKTFQRLLEEPYVLRRVSLLRFPLRPWFRDEEFQRGFTRFVHNCAAAGNESAKYRLGIVQYLLHDSDGEQQQEGLQRIAGDAAKEAQFLYGSILICLGGETKTKGFQIVTPVILPMENRWPYDWMESSWMEHIDELRWKGLPMVQRLKRSYIRENCNCGGLKEGLYENPGTYWERYERFQNINKMISSLSCQICLCHYVIQLFFFLMEDYN